MTKINISELNCLFPFFCTCTFQMKAHIWPFTFYSTYTLAFKPISNKHKLPYVLSQHYNHRYRNVDTVFKDFMCRIVTILGRSTETVDCLEKCCRHVLHLAVQTGKTFKTGIAGLLFTCKWQFYCILLLRKLVNMKYCFKLSWKWPDTIVMMAT